MHILVTGGAGYIGSFMTKRLLDDGHTVVVADNLSRGHKDYIDPRAEFVQGDLLDKEYVSSLFTQKAYDGVIHFAGYISVGESMLTPSIYFQNNVDSVINLIDAMKVTNNNNFIFSSTAGVYGNPKTIPIPENHEKNPESPYGESKLMAERLLSWYHKTLDMNVVCLRYFNACGAALDGSHGENHDPETHIIPNAMKAVLEKKPFILFGDDYVTEDGTCVRDYIHVLDLVEAHMLALKKLQDEGGMHIYNVGTGKGYSNKQILETIRKVTGNNIETTVEKRRQGDAGTLVADAAKIQDELGFSPTHSDLETIISSAWKWHQKQNV